MSSHIFTFEIDSTNLHCRSIESFDASFTSLFTNIQRVNSNHQRAPPNPYTSTNFPLTSVNLDFSPWRPSKKLSNLHKRFQDVILYQHPCIPCSYCSRLMYPSETRWLCYDPTFSYPLRESFPSVPLQFHPNDSTLSRIAICCSCSKPSTRRHPPKVDPIPDDIQNVPMYNRIYLSPVHLNCSLGRIPNSNPYTNYRHIQGSFGYSRNINAFALYTGTVGAILSNGERNSWYHPSLLNASKWLRENNKFFQPYEHYFNRGTTTGPPLIIPTATLAESDEDSYNHTTNSTIRSTGPQDIVISGEDFDIEIHNEDYRYERLMAGFMTSDTNETQLPISFSDSSLEALIFPDLFPLGRFHFADIKESRLETRYKIDTYGNYIKLAIMCPDPRFRLHWYWPHFSYINLEKYRNHQNKTRLVRQKITDNHMLPTITDLITESVYSGRAIVDESYTTTLPSFIRTGDSFWRKKEHQLNTIVQNFGLPQIFYTITMGEGKWKYLHKILKKTDKDALSSNRPFHTYHHYTNRLQSLHHYLWNNPNLSNLGKWLHYFERDEFQNRGAIHTHGVAWLDKSIPDLISSNEIRADMPDPITEPELYKLVKKHQVHHCIPSKCGGPCSNGGQCDKKFPKPLSETTYFDNETGRFVYRRTKPEDQWVVSYHAPTLLLWEAHHNFQYVTDKHFAKYMCKYVTKPEPSELFNIQEADAFRRHIHARRLGTMELMLLLMGKKASRCSIAVDFLPTTPPEFRSKAVKPIWMLVESDDIDPYYENAIEKYFERPDEHEFDNITYPKYFQKYKIISSIPQNQTYWRDKKNRIIIKRKKEILVRFQYLTIKNAESFFYQQLLFNKSARSENELKGNHSTYRSAFQYFYPSEYTIATQDVINGTNLSHSLYSRNYKNLIDNLLTSMQQNIKDIIGKQLCNLIPKPIIISDNEVLNTPPDQYEVYNIITTCWGSLKETKKYPHFFITGSAGTGKTYLTKQIIQYLKSINKKFLLMAPTGVAAENVGGETIHSKLKITGNVYNLQTLSLYDEHSKSELKKMEYIIIDEISMVSSQLLTFISKVFCKLHNNLNEFGGIPVLVVGDLAQLPPVKGDPVFYSPIWKRFFPLFLRSSRRQQNDNQFFKILQEVRSGILSEETILAIMSKVEMYQEQNNALDTTHIVSHRKMAQTINSIISTKLPSFNSDEESFTSISVDFVNNEQWDRSQSEKAFMHYTNYPVELVLAVGTRVMFLNNTQFRHGLYNGSIGVVMKICDQENIEVAFPLTDGIKTFTIQKDTVFFTFNGMPAKRTQFPLQNAFALTVHKTQSITLPHSTLSLDQSIFACGQAYVAMSRSPSWDKLDITSFNINSIKTDKRVLKEYERLEEIYNKNIRSFLA